MKKFIIVIIGIIYLYLSCLIVFTQTKKSPLDLTIEEAISFSVNSNSVGIVMMFRPESMHVSEKWKERTELYLARDKIKTKIFIVKTLGQEAVIFYSNKYPVIFSKIPYDRDVLQKVSLSIDRSEELHRLYKAEYLRNEMLFDLSLMTLVTDPKHPYQQLLKEARQFSKNANSVGVIVVVSEQDMNRALESKKQIEDYFLTNKMNGKVFIYKDTASGEILFMVNDISVESSPIIVTKEVLNKVRLKLKESQNTVINKNKN